MEHQAPLHTQKSEIQPPESLPKIFLVVLYSS